MSGDDWPAADMDPIAPPRRSRALLWVLIAGSVLATLAFLPAAVMGMMSPMLSDGGLNVAVWTLIILALSFPLILLIGPLGGWVAYAARRERVAWALILSPLAWVAALALAMLFAF